MNTKKFKSNLIFIIAVFMLTTAAASGEDTLEGYSLVVKADYRVVCPV